MKKILLILMLVFVSDIQAQVLSIGIQSLKGLKGVEVIVENLKPDIEEDGLTKSQIKTDVELKLRLAGIKVTTHEEWLKEPGSPYLYINVNSIKDEEIPVYSFHIEVSLAQDVLLLRDTEIIIYGATTWKTGFIGFSGTNNVVDSIRSSVKDKVNKFINDYLTANPK